jgi:hypothetical protein
MGLYQGFYCNETPQLGVVLSPEVPRVLVAMVFEPWIIYCRFTREMLKIIDTFI